MSETMQSKLKTKFYTFITRYFPSLIHINQLIFQKSDEHLPLIQDFQKKLHALKKKKLNYQGKKLNCSKLPFYLIVGEKNSGKTNLLKKSAIPFFLKEDAHPLAISWWLSPQGILLDIPSEYFANEEDNISQRFQCLLLLLKKRMIQGRVGVIITVSIADVFKASHLDDMETYSQLLLKKLNTLSQFTSLNIPCYLIFTKCDLITGFIDFFANSSKEEQHQPWGMKFSGKETYTIFSNEFNKLIKLLNEQLIWRMQLETHSFIKSRIKDFPLELEKIKENISSVVKHLMINSLKLKLFGIYFTSAKQIPDQNCQLTFLPTTLLLNEKELLSEAYFTKHLFSSALHPVKENTPKKYRFSKYIFYLSILSTSLYFVFSFIKDYQLGAQQLKLTKEQFVNYHHTLSRNYPIDAQILTSLALLNNIEKNMTVKKSSYIFSPYSYQANEKIKLVYHSALSRFFMPEIKRYLESYLMNPINKDFELVYAVLKSYLMLGDNNHYQADFIFNTLQKIVPNHFSEGEKNSFKKHLSRSLKENFKPMALNGALIKQTREFLSALTGFQLSFLILKNTNNTLIPENIFLQKINRHTNSFIMSASGPIAYLFTGDMFNKTFYQTTKKAAKEALIGNWVLGDDFKVTSNPDLEKELSEQLQSLYMTHYINAWRNLLTHIHLRSMQSLADVDQLINQFMNRHSTFLSFLKTIRENTGFSPLLATNAQFQQLNALFTQTLTPSLLEQIFQALFRLHLSLNTVLSAEQSSKASYDLIADRLLKHENTDEWVSLRLLALKSPEPINTWLIKIADLTWYFLMIEANSYINLSWQQQSEPTLNFSPGSYSLQRKFVNIAEIKNDSLKL